MGGNVLLEKYIAESSVCEFKVSLEKEKPKSWLKSVSAFANRDGGVMLFGINNDREIIGIDNVQKDAEKISRLIKDKMIPVPEFDLIPEKVDSKDILILRVKGGDKTPYYYRGDGVMETFIRIGNESVIAPNYVVNNLILNGLNLTYDCMVTSYNFADFSFSKLRERHKVWTGKSLDDKFYDSFNLRAPNGKLTNAGVLIADDSPVRHSRLFCTRWNGLDKSGGIMDAIDSAEYSGSLILLFNEGMGFVKRNMKTMWKKTPNSRIEMPDYCERSVFEGLVNALIHRDYLELGSEVHIDIFDDRLSITSPGGMADGTNIQDRDIESVASKRRNPALADVFSQLGFMERQGSGFKKIKEAYQFAHNYTEDLAPEFYSDGGTFWLTLYNLNYGKEDLLEEQKTLFGNEKPLFSNEKPLFEEQKTVFEKVLEGARLGSVAKKHARILFEVTTFENVFSRSQVTATLGLSQTSAGDFINRLKYAGLIYPVKGRGKGKYKFVNPDIHEGQNTE